MPNDWTEYLARISAKDQQPMQAAIREEECIGCLKCLRACPVDAIVGAAKQMHTVITSECTGCELCVEPCPVDCIDMIPAIQQAQDLTKVRRRFEARIKRLDRAKQPEKALSSAEEALAARKAYIVAALARVKARRG